MMLAMIRPNKTGVYGDIPRQPTPEGHPRLLTVNGVLPQTLVFLVEA
jgi:hypothetical protein